MNRLVGASAALGVLFFMARSWAQEPPATAVRGATLRGIPDHLPAAPRVEPTLDRVRAHLEAGDTEQALADANHIVETAKWGREKDAATMVVGFLNREAGRHNLASEAFTQVRAGKGPLSSVAAWYEAEQDLRRGRPWSAIAECGAIVKARPDSDEADDCGRIIALAHAAAGESGLARAAAAEYDLEHEHGPIAEQVEVRLARRWQIARPDLAASVWRQLALHHDAPLTGRLAEESLHDLAAAGVENANLGSTDDVRMARAISMRDSARQAEAWSLFDALRGEAATKPAVARFVAAEHERFAWRTRHWDELAELYRLQYESNKQSSVAFSRYKVLVRGGRFDEASSWALAMQKAHGRGTPFYRSEEEIGRTMMLAGRYTDAVVQFDAVATRGGWTGRRAAASAAFAALMGGDAASALSRYDAVIVKQPDEVELRYWRARALDTLDRADEAQAERTFVLETEPYSWYATLLRQGDEGRPLFEPFARNGTWPGPAPAPPPAPSVLDLPTAALVVANRAPEVSLLGFRPVGATPVFGDAHLAALAWPWNRAVTTLPTASWVRGDDPLKVPPTYRASAEFDPAGARADLLAFAEANGRSFPELLAIADLARAGLTDESGTRMSVFYRDLRKRSSNGDRAARALLDAGPPRWHTYFLAAHDHHDAARSLFDSWNDIEDPRAATEWMRLGYPLAHGRYVWTESREHGVDPMLVLGLMRQESTYNARAVSRAGARGPMQIMPRTGHLLADLADDIHYNAGDLSDPDLATRYGIWYLGLLLDRFDGVYPLAVASYNGGPHNMSSWLQGPAKDLPMDALVEHIPFRETRDYVKKVSEGYAVYVALYGPTGSVVHVPSHVVGDHAEVVDF